MDACARALEELYATRYGSFRHALTTVTGNRESAHDAVQEAFARALAARDTFRGEAPLAAWVWKIALRVALEQRTPDHDDWPDDVIDPQLLEPERDPALAAALRMLSPRKRLMVFLHYFGDFSYAEISAACDVAEGTVAASLAQAREQLHRTLTYEGASK